MIPLLLIPAFLPKHAHARTAVQTRQTVEVWPANHHREEAPVVSTSNTNSHPVAFRDAFDGDIPQHHSAPQQHSPVPHHVSPQHHSGFEADMPRHHSTPMPQTQQSVADSSNARVAGALQGLPARGHDCALDLCCSICKFGVLRHNCQALQIDDKICNVVGLPTSLASPVPT